MATATEVQKAYLAFFGRPADPVGLTYWQTQTVAAMNTGFAASTEYTALYTGMTPAQMVAQVYTNLLGRTADVPGLLYWAGEMTAGRQTVASLVTSMQASALGADITTISNRVTYAAAFTAALDTVAEITAYTGTAAANSARTQVASVLDTAASLTAATTALTTSVATVVAAGTAATTTATTTFQLTTSADRATGTYVDGSRFLSGGTFVDTLGSSDTITGTTGTTDTLFVQSVANATVTPSSITAVEVLTIENTAAAAYTLSLANADSAIKTVNVNNTTGSTVTVTNNPTSFSNLGLSNVSQAVSIGSISTAVAGTADTLAITLNSVTGSPGLTVTGYETLNITSNGTVTNALGLIADTSLKAITVAGARASSFSYGGTTLTSMDANAATAAVTFTTTGASAISVTGGSANDSFTLTGTYTTADTIAGGSGTDTLVINNAEATGATATQSNVSAMEVISVSDGLSGTLTMSNWGVTSLTQGAALAAATTVAFAAGTDTITLSTFTQAGNALTVTAAGVATTDALNLTIGLASSSTGNNQATSLTLTGFETLNISSVGAANTITALTMTNTAATEAIVITGDQSLTLATSIVADSINASGMTGTSSTLVMGTNANTLSMTITGTLNADTLFGGTVADIISGGSGNDTISNRADGTAGAVGDVITGGSGSDTFILRGDLASAAIATAEAGVARITDFNVSGGTGVADILSVSSKFANYAALAVGVNGSIAANTAVAAGVTIVQSVGQNASAAAMVTGLDLIKLTTGVATTGLTTQTAFNLAIGSASVTGLTALKAVFYSMYDTTNSCMLIGTVDDTAAGGATTSVESGDTVTLIGRLDMSATEYAAFASANFALVAA